MEGGVEDQGRPETRTHRPTDKEHGDRAHNRDITNEWLQNHPHHPMQLRREEMHQRPTLNTAYLSTFLTGFVLAFLLGIFSDTAYLYSLDSSFTEIPLHLDIDLNIADIASWERKDKEKRKGERECFA